MHKGTKTHFLKILTSFLAVIIITSCDADRVFEDNIDFDEPYWIKQNVPVFNFDIVDTTAAYNMYINVRNGMDYPFYNLYYEFDLKDSVGKSLKKEMQELILFDAKTGKPQGSGLGDLFDHQHSVLKGYQFKSPGTYTLTYTHFMRPDTLPLILSVGARVEKDINQTPSE